MHSWKFEEANDLINTWDENKELFGLILKGRLLKNQGKFQEALDQINKAIEKAIFTKDEVLRFTAIGIKCNILMRLGKMGKVTDLFKTGQQIEESFSSELMKQTMWARAYFYNYRGVFRMLNGDMELSLIDFNHSLDLSEQSKSDYIFGTCTQNLGEYYKILGDLDTATKYLNQAKRVYITLDYPYGVAIVQSNIGDILRFKGKINESKNCLNNALEGLLKEKTRRDPHLISFCYRRLGRIYHLFKDTEQAFTNYYKALDIIEEGSHPVAFVEIIVDIIMINIDTGNKIEVEAQNKKLEIISKNNPDNRRIALHLGFVQAIKLLKYSTRLKDLSEAENKLMKIIKGEVISNEIYVLSIIYYLEILFIELKIIQNEEVIEKITNYTSLILDIATKQNSIPLIIDVHILKSKIAFLNLSHEDAINQLNMAHKYATENKLSYLTDKIEKEKKLTIDNLSYKSKFSDMDGTISSRIVEIDIISYLNDVSRIIRS